MALDNNFWLLQGGQCPLVTPTPAPPDTASLRAELHSGYASSCPALTKWKNHTYTRESFKEVRKLEPLHHKTDLSRDVIRVWKYDEKDGSTEILIDDFFPLRDPDATPPSRPYSLYFLSHPSYFTNHAKYGDYLREDVPVPRFVPADNVIRMNVWMSPPQSTIHDTGLHYDDDDGVLIVISGEKSVTVWPPADTKALRPISVDRSVVKPLYELESTPNFVQIQQQTNLSLVVGNSFSAHYRVEEGMPQYTGDTTLPSSAVLWWTLDQEETAVSEKIREYIRKAQVGGNISATWSFKQIPSASGGEARYNWELYYWGWRAPTWSELLDDKIFITAANADSAFTNTNPLMTLEGVKELNRELGGGLGRGGAFPKIPDGEKMIIFSNDLQADWFRGAAREECDVPWQADKTYDGYHIYTLPDSTPLTFPVTGNGYTLKGLEWAKESEYCIFTPHKGAWCNDLIEKFMKRHTNLQLEGGELAEHVLGQDGKRGWWKTTRTIIVIDKSVDGKVPMLGVYYIGVGDGQGGKGRGVEVVLDLMKENGYTGELVDKIELFMEQVRALPWEWAENLVFERDGSSRVVRTALYGTV